MDRMLECMENAGIRRSKYRSYWKCLANLGAWNLPEYLQRKESLMQGERAVIHQREVMPVCVLKQVRGLYPNPSGIPYMGHKWQ